MSVKQVVMAAAGALGGGGNPNAWDVSKAYYDAGADAWDISKAYWTGRTFNLLDVSARETSPNGLFFKPDGTKMYILGATGDDVNEYTLSTPWLLSSATYSQNFSVATEDTAPNDISFKPDGTKMYVIGGTGDAVYEYNLSSAWDISTASYLQNISILAEEASPQGLFFKPDGTKMYLCGGGGNDVNEYDLSTAWDVTTASYVQNFSVATEDTQPTGVFFKPDGTKMYIAGNAGDGINEYDLSSAWDISTASYVQNFYVGTQDTFVTSVFFHPEGSSFYITGSQNDTVYQYIIGGFSVSGQEGAPSGLFFKPDGTKMYINGTVGNDVNEYDLSTAWDVNTASYVQNFSVAAQEGTPNDLFFKPDGTKMYIIGSNGDDVNEYNLSSAWDVSTASYLQNFSVNAQEITPEGLFFSPVGTKMYVVGASGDDVNEYDLSSAWDISTASYVQNFSVATEETEPLGLFFKPDGTKMYVVGNSSDAVNEYTLSSAWDISTASYSQNFSTVAQESVTQGVFFKPDGTQFWTIGSSEDRVSSHLISPE